MFTQGEISDYMATITVINGPNLNLLGTREPELYGRATLLSIQNGLELLATELGHELTFHQSNAEHKIIDLIHQSGSGGVDMLIINPAAFTHTSVAIRDAVLGVGIPFIEVHLSNVYSREAFRKHSYFSDIAEGVISGFGENSYHMALTAAHQILLAR